MKVKVNEREWMNERNKGEKRNPNLDDAHTHTHSTHTHTQTHTHTHT